MTDDGSPFRTGILNNWYPQFKRIAAILGDLTFTLTRRLFLEMAAGVNPDVPSWSYLATYDYGTPIMGTFHGSDLLQVFFGILPNYAARSIRGYYFSFVHDLDPNSNNDLPEWPQWSQGKELKRFEANSDGGTMSDDFREDSYDFIVNNVEAFHI